jgi:Mce-associated membrane protein
MRPRFAVDVGVLMAARSTNGTRAGSDDAQVAAAEADAAEADAAEAEALAVAAAARAKAARLRKQAEESRAALAASEAAARARQQAAEATASEDAEDAEHVDGDTADEIVDPVDAEPITLPEDEPAAVDAPAEGWRRFAPGWRIAAVSGAAVALVALLVLSGLMIWSHHKVAQREQLSTEFATGARQGVVNLMSLNFNNGQADLQRVLDSTTGSFHDDFEKSQKDFLTVMKDSKVVTSTAVTSTAIESMTSDSAVVLLTATSQVANNASQQPTPRSWRLSVTVNKENDQIKMSKVEFVP